MRIVITGGSGAIGSMCARAAAQKGWDVVLTYHKNKNKCLDFAEQLKGFGGRIIAVEADITDAHDRKALLETVKSQPGGVDILVNNAGQSLYGLLQQTSEEEIERIIQTDLTAQILLTRLFLPDMIAAKSGSIVNISSIWGLTGASCEAVYSAAKAGIIGFTKALAKEVAPCGIRVNAVAPGVVDSAMMERFSASEKKEICDDIPLGRFAHAAEIAESILFMAGQEYITGQVLSPNGGSVI